MDLQAGVIWIYRQESYRFTGRSHIDLQAGAIWIHRQESYSFIVLQGGVMDIYRDQIDRVVYEQRKLLEEYTDEYKLATVNDKGEHLICGKNNGKENLYCAYKENGKYIRKCVNGDRDAINALARKEYLRVSIDALKKNLAAYDGFCGKLEDLDFDAIKSKMQKAYRDLPMECFFSNVEGRGAMMCESSEDRFAMHREWAKAWYEKSTYKPEGLRYPTSAGFNVRSKSEQHIVEQLVNYGVPFRYEQVIHIGHINYSADFTFRDRNLNKFYWEHAGMMGDPGYVDGYYKKRDAFESVGIVPWTNLIVTYDIDDVINVPSIKGIIENEVIPRL